MRVKEGGEKEEEEEEEEDEGEEEEQEEEEEEEREVGEAVLRPLGGNAGASWGLVWAS